jgi:Stage II sporulation protein E (SpoIIE)
MLMKDPIPWLGIPLRTRIIFLAAVFCVFVGIGTVNDIIAMGRWTTPRFGISVGVTGLFAMGYASSGVILRHRFWKAMLPLMAVQFVTMGFLAYRFPDAPQLTQMNTAETRRLHNRMAFDGNAVIISVVLGYVGFVHVSITVAKRFGRAQVEKVTLESEMAAAREVQRLMVPEDLPPVRGYAIESVYLPAAQVGGDFFQVIPLKSGPTLVVIGDVSGKGLRAAMIVSMLVGMLRTVSGYTEEPAEILDDLNQRLCGQTRGGFATCLVVRLDDDGRIAVANAGHPSPYLNGAEVPFAGSMPLGLDASAIYEQTTLEMRAGDRAVLLTDGIPEARDEHGALFGFPRVESLLGEGASAKALAETAQQHGQNDDITVISIARQAQIVAGTS